MLLITYLLYLIGRTFLEVGSISLYKAAVNEINPESTHFFDGVKKYFFTVLSGTFMIHLITLLLSPIIIIFLLIYVPIVGSLTAGWGLVFLSVFVMVFLFAWTTIVVVDNLSPFKAVGKSIKLGKKYFLPLFIIMLAYF